MDRLLRARPVRQHRGRAHVEIPERALVQHHRRRTVPRPRGDGRHFDELSTSMADRRQQLQVLYAALQALPLDLQITLELFYWEELPAIEIGSILGVPEGTVRSRLRRARQRLAEGLHRLGPVIAEPTLADLETWARELRDRIGRS